MRSPLSKRSATRIHPRSMAICLCSTLALAALLQAPAAPLPASGTAADSLPGLRERLAHDSSDGRAWLLLGRLYLQRAAGAHDPPHRALEDSAAVRALLDTTDDALDRAGRPPAPRIGWSTRPLVWVAGPHLKDDRVPPRDFVFAALRLALDNNDAWAPPALALYARAARTTPALCEALKTFRLTNEIPRCHR